MMHTHDVEFWSKSPEQNLPLAYWNAEIMLDNSEVVICIRCNLTSQITSISLQ